MRHDFLRKVWHSNNQHWWVLKLGLQATHEKRNPNPHGLHLPANK